MLNEELIILLEELQKLPRECEWVEFKHNNQNPEEIGEYISALSNSACYHNKDFAFLVFGVQDKTHELIGTTFKPFSTKIKNQELENWIATQLNPKIDFNIYELRLAGKNIVIIRIPATQNTPVYFKNQAYIRIGTYKKKLLDHPEKERAIWKKTRTTSFEKALAKEKVTEDEVLKLIDYPGFFEMLRLPLPVNRDGIIERLLEEKLILRKKSFFDITNLGAVLFAKNIDQFETLARKAVRVIIYEGNNRVITRREQTGQKGYANGFQGLINFISGLVPVNEIIDKGLRKEISKYPLLAIRELIANAIIHQDFEIAGSSPMVEFFENRIEITNPGKPLIDTLRFVDHSPESRNEILARFMRRVNICEERGSGIDKVIFECELNQLPAPDFIMGDNYTRVILYGHKTLLEMDKKDKIRACYLHSCLKHVSGENMTNQSLRERFGIKEHNYSIASRIISDTIREGLVKEFDPENRSKKYAKYLPFWA